MMNRHLPAGQGMPPDLSRRRPYNQHQHQQQQYPPQMYNPYMQPYAPNYYPQPMPQYGPPQQYTPYPPYVRSPPPVAHYAPVPPMPQQLQVQYPRPQPSPALSTPYQPPPPPPPPPSQTPPAQTPPSTQSSYIVPGPMTPLTLHAALSITPSPQEENATTPFRAPLPWLSRPDLPWPARRARRKRKVTQQLSAEPVELPVIAQGTSPEPEVDEGPTPEVELEPRAETEVPRPETPLTSRPGSENAESTNPTTPSSIQQFVPAGGDTTPIAPKQSQKSTVPVVPAIPKSVPREALKVASEDKVEETPKTVIEEGEDVTKAEPEQSGPEEVKEIAAPKAWTTPKLWTGLFNPAAVTPTAASSESGVAAATPCFNKTNSESLAEALRSFAAVSPESKVAFLEPRGLVNTGNMCYMNSVLQVLIFCAPFYNFLDQVSKKAAHSFKSETPLIDAMVLFMREYPVIDSAPSIEKLRMRLKENELEQYGEAFTPDFVYNVINRLPRFSTMRRGHQQDAEEFLGFLLEGLHDECVSVMRNSTSNNTSAMATPTNGPSSPTSEVGSAHGSASGKENGWLEVGPKQKPAVTRSSGTITTGSPITKIFGGNLRSELRVPGLKDSVTLEPYQPLQLDIGALHVNNIIDALKGLTRSEALHGDFKSPKGPNVSASKQVFIETVPPVLILHLKRFQYDNAGGTQKIWKKIGYPLELEIPKEVFPRQKRSVYAHGGLPKYKLIAVVYHHGKNASGGHYTVDVRRQDGREWIRLDDTVIRRVRSEEVAEAGSEEDPKVLAAALEGQKKDTTSGNGFSAIGDIDEENEEGWKQASGPGKKWSSVVNGTSTPKAKVDKFSVKDNKVAYLLFYQKI